MYLSKLEIFGFKSFAQKTNINFNEGVTSIVGPNGCGKTNIVDAIRWCLGEQKSSTLRSDKMENVIFNGTSQRKPMGMAEVSLTIENTKDILPIEYTDVTITRRIFRSGESEYLLNKNLCRLKDITNLFMDTGIGANAYSVIELKMVETILSSKAEERRVLFEEAAGVNKYKLRRRLAIRKLDEVKADLIRVSDIVTEVTKNVNSLERQAKRADRYNNLSSTLKELELELAERELALFTVKLEQTKKLKDENLEKKNSLELKLNGLQEKLSAIRDKIRSAENEIKVKRTGLADHTEKIYSFKNEISIFNERKKSDLENTGKYKAEIEELKKRFESASDVIKNSKQSINDVTVKIENNRIEQQKYKSSIENLTVLLEERKTKVKKQSEEIVSRFKAVSNKENELQNISKELGDKNKEIARHNERILKLTGDVAKTVGFIESLIEEKENVTDKLNEAEENYSRQAREKERLEKELNRLRAKELEQKSLINGLSEKIDFIRNLVDNLEGISRGTKSLIEETSWAKNEIALLANAGTCPDELRTAVESSLKNNINNILVSTLEDVNNGIKYLKMNNLGRASFYLVDKKESISPGIAEKLLKFIINNQKKKISKDKAFVTWASGVIKSEGNWQGYFKKLLDNTAVVEDLKAAIELSSKYSKIIFTTLDGDYVSGEGIIESGASLQLGDSLFGKKQLLDDLVNELPLRVNELTEISDDVLKLEETIGKIDLKVLSDEGKMLVNDLANIDKQISLFEYEKQKANDEIEKTHKLVQDCAAEANKFDNEKNRIAEELNEIMKERSAAEAELKRLEDNSRNTENEFNSFISRENEIKLELERNLGEIRNLESIINQSTGSLDNIRNSVSSRENDINNFQSELVEIDKSLNEKSKELYLLEEKKNNLADQLNRIEKNYDVLKSNAASVEDEQNEFRSEKDSILDTNRDLDIKLNETVMKKDNLLEHIKEEYSIEIELKNFDDQDSFNFDERRNEVHELRQRIKNLGPINLLAYSEYEEERQRMEFLTEQRDDLIESEKDIIKTIEEINHTAQTQFMQTFDQIRENFIRVFRTLFNPGDEVDLKLEEEADPLEAKIEITAKPKGKRPTSIELLSGGEKTLTAIALLFAIYLVKPSPFCILDEIDAPLDDANIDRFTRLLKDFSSDTQFIVVTHNKRTMESAETLYGVTMQEEGISKLVSVRFNEELPVTV